MPREMCYIWLMILFTVSHILQTQEKENVEYVTRGDDAKRLVFLPTARFKVVPCSHATKEERCKKSRRKKNTHTFDAVPDVASIAK